jgi:hypothetical protein
MNAVHNKNVHDWSLLTLSLKTGKIQENNEAVKNKASQFPFAVWKSFSFNEKHKEGMNGKNEGKDGQLKK